MLPITSRVSYSVLCTTTGRLDDVTETVTQCDTCVREGMQNHLQGVCSGRVVKKFFRTKEEMLRFLLLETPPSVSIISVCSHFLRKIKSRVQTTSFV